MRASVVLVKKNRLPSGEKLTKPRRALAGTAILRSAPVAIVRSVMPVPDGARCGPFVFGLIRRPPSRSIGCDSSWIDGMLARDISAIVSPAGLTTAVGSGSASRMSTMALGGVR